MATIDLQQDAAEIQAMLAEAVRKYAEKHQASRTAKKHPVVTRIDLSFSLGDGESIPWVHLCFDTKPGGEPDGNPTHPDFAKLKRKGWRDALLAVCEGEEVAVTQTNGKVKKCGDEDLAEVIGDFLVKMLLEANKAGVFAELPRAERCELGVEDPSTGDFGWPNYEDRGKKNLVK